MASGVALMVGVDISLLRATAHATTDFQVDNASINSGADYVEYFTGTQTNFSPGLVDSSFPLAHVHIDNSPFSEATATPADTGNAGGLAVNFLWNQCAATIDPHCNATGTDQATLPTLSQPQYADVKYPPGSKQPATVGAPGGPFAQASAALDQASAYASVASTTQTSASSTSSGAVSTATSAGSAVSLGPAPTGTTTASSTTDPRTAQIDSFNAAMTAWRSAYLTPAAAAKYPASPADASTPDGTDGDTSSATLGMVDGKGLVATGDARVQQASFGGGAFVVHGVHTSVVITNDGTPSSSIVTTIADASVGGVPVTIGKDGVSVTSQTVPPDAVAQASAALNMVLGNLHMTISALAPNDTKSSGEEAITASGLTIVFDSPGPPEQRVRHDLGHTFVDNLAIPAEASTLPATVSSPIPPVTGATAGSAGGTTPVTSTFIPGTPGSPGTAGSSAPSAGTAAPAAPSQTTLPTSNASAQGTAPAKPMWLLTAYFAWQTLMVGAAAALWWWRSAAGVAARAVT